MTQEYFNNIHFYFHLLQIGGLGPNKILNLKSKFQSFDELNHLSYKSLLEVDGISDLLAKRIIKSLHELDSTKQELYDELTNLNKIGGKALPYFDAKYPSLLKRIYSPPLILFIKGELSDEDKNSLAMVGTRNPTAYGKKQAEILAGELNRNQITIISGLARGIDSIAHRTSVQNSARTIAVIGSGLDIIYPKENKKMFDQIIENGAVISEYRLKTKPDAQNFPKRNRIISGMSLGTIVVETKQNGGAVQTAHYALDQNREVFAVPGNLGVPQNEGANLLIKKGEAKLIQNIDDVLEELKLKIKPIVGKNISKPKIDLSLFEEQVFNVLDEINAIQIDKISEICGLSTSDCLVQLLTLEFKGLVKQLPGKLFQKA